MNKTISINPDLFRFTNERNTRKSAPPKPKQDIKVRSQVKEKDKQKKCANNMYCVLFASNKSVILEI